MRDGAIQVKEVKTSRSLEMASQTHQPIYLSCLRLQHRSNLMAKAENGVQRVCDGNPLNKTNLPSKNRTIAAPQKTTKNP